MFPNKTVFFALTALLFGCGASAPIVESAKPPPGPVRMRHQIMFSQGSEQDTYVFEGYMILVGDSFTVRAFAGPGVDLFTVTRSGEKRRDELHIASLKDRIDVAQVGDDIARVYLGGCGKPESPGQAECDFFGEKMIEIFDADGRLAKRLFPSAHGAGMTIRYEEYADYSGRLEPARISINWNKSKNLMVIRLLTCEPLDKLSPGIFDIP